MKSKDKVIIIRVTDEEAKIAKELRQKYSINISSLVRERRKKHYTDLIGEQDGK